MMKLQATHSQKFHGSQVMLQTLEKEFTRLVLWKVLCYSPRNLSAQLLNHTCWSCVGKL